MVLGMANSTRQPTRRAALRRTHKGVATRPNRAGDRERWSVAGTCYVRLVTLSPLDPRRVDTFVHAHSMMLAINRSNWSRTGAADPLPRVCPPRAIHEELGCISAGETRPTAG